MGGLQYALESDTFTFKILQKHQVIYNQWSKMLK